MCVFLFESSGNSGNSAIIVASNYSTLATCSENSLRAKLYKHILFSITQRQRSTPIFWRDRTKKFEWNKVWSFHNATILLTYCNSSVTSWKNCNYWVSTWMNMKHIHQVRIMHILQKTSVKSSWIPNIPVIILCLS